MKPDIFFKYACNAPRYTSYPTANHFSDAVDSSIYIEWLGAISDDAKISLYIHIPYCEEMCFYCGCHTKITKKQAPVKKYLAALLKEIELVSSQLKDNISVSHIHFGGGSPTILEPQDFLLLMKCINRFFSVDNYAEIAIEIDPRHINEQKVAAYKLSGVNRASLGVQDFNYKVQKAIGRIQPFEVVRDTVDMLRYFDIMNINFDLIYGLPYQSMDMMLKTIQQSIDLSPQNIALFGYAHVPWMKKHMRIIPEEALPLDRERFEIFQKSSQCLKENGYVPIGLDHFTKESSALKSAIHNKHLKRNFQGYTTDNADILIGLGASSISQFPNGYAQNTTIIPDYHMMLDQGELPVKKGIEINHHDRMVSDIIANLMCYLHVDLEDIAQQHAYPIEDFANILDDIHPMICDGLVQRDGFEINISPDARQITRVLCSYFDTYFEGRPKTHSSVA